MGEGLSMTHAAIHLVKKIMALSLRRVGEGFIFHVSRMFSFREFYRCKHILVPEYVHLGDSIVSVSCLSARPECAFAALANGFYHSYSIMRKI